MLLQEEFLLLRQQAEPRSADETKHNLQSDKHNKHSVLTLSFLSTTCFNTLTQNIGGPYGARELRTAAK